jgi:hypothetical protein
VLHEQSWATLSPRTVSEATLVKRINRTLAKSGLRLRTSRPGSLTAALAGRYYLVYGTTVARLRVGIDELGRALGVLKESESTDSAGALFLARQPAGLLKDQ